MSCIKRTTTTTIPTFMLPVYVYSISGSGSDSMISESRKLQEQNKCPIEIIVQALGMRFKYLTSEGVKRDKI